MRRRCTARRLTGESEDLQMLNCNYNEKFVKEGLTFDDVLLIPAKSDVTPNMIDLRTNLTKNITLNTPIMTSAMDTVTESRMAIAIAREGGIGIIHKNMSIEQQVDEVDTVSYTHLTLPTKLEV